jgi:hypothetical protein
MRDPGPLTPLSREGHPDILGTIWYERYSGEYHVPVAWHGEHTLIAQVYAPSGAGLGFCFMVALRGLQEVTPEHWERVQAEYLCGVLAR